MLAKSICLLLLLELIICPICVSATVDTSFVDYSGSILAVELQVPVISGLDNPAMERWLNSIIAASLGSFVGPVAQAAQELALEIGFENMNSVALFPFYVNSSYDVMRNDEKIISLLLDKYEFTGGAHGLSHWEAVNFHLETGKFLELNDLFCSGKQWREMLMATINFQMANDPAADYFAPQRLAADWTPDPKQFYLTDTELVIFFDLYEIAPYSHGHPTFSISFESIRDYLSPEFSYLWSTSSDE